MFIHTYPENIQCTLICASVGNLKLARVENIGFKANRSYVHLGLQPGSRAVEKSHPHQVSYPRPHCSIVNSQKELICHSLSVAPWPHRNPTFLPSVDEVSCESSYPDKGVPTHPSGPLPTPLLTPNLRGSRLPFPVGI